MQSKTLSSKGLFSPALFRNDLVRFWPLWALYLVMWLLMVPAFQFLELFGQNGWGNATDMQAYAMSGVASMATGAALVMSVGFGCLFAMTLFSYFTGTRAVGFVHALPTRREGLFLTHYLAGAAVFIGTHAITALLTALIWSTAGLGELWVIGLWFLYTTGQMLFFYSFAVLCAALAGQMLAIPVFYGVFNCLVYGMTNLIWLLCQLLLYGWTNPDDPALVVWLTPINKLAQLSWNRWGYSRGSEEYWRFLQNGLGTVGVYALVGVVMTVVALLIYRRRHSESAGDTVAMSWAKPVFRYGVGVCAALSLGQLLYIILWDAFGQTEQSPVALVICMAGLGLVGYFAAEMLLQKSFHILKRSWKGGAVLVAVLILVCVALELDIPGVERRVPTAEEIQSLEFRLYGQDSIYGDSEDPEMIERFLTLHQMLVEERPKDNDWDEDALYGSIGLDYTLKSGAHLHRHYSFTILPSEIEAHAALAEQLTELARDPEVWQAYMKERFEPGRLVTVDMYLDSENRTLTFEGDTAREILAALEKDIEAGHTGAYIFDSKGWSANTYSTNLSFYYRAQEDAGNGNYYNSSYSEDVQFSKDYTYLLAALEKAGVDTERLSTYQNYYDEDYNEYVKEASYQNTYAEESQETPIPDTLTPEGDAAIIGGADGPTAVYVG
ncbi:hypothetical protein [Oscillibacter sp. GMB15532]|uniref:hypothetical protein n=1 Tax=Oscillibacter sp. GMB15532 TaxID=3230022 RepID=UPI0034DF68AB